MLRAAAEPRGGASSGSASAASAAERVAGVAAGSLVFFAGRLSLHRVSPVHGPRPRINAILTYEKEPGQLANPCAWLRCRTPASLGRSFSVLTLAAPPPIAQILWKSSLDERQRSSRRICRRLHAAVRADRFHAIVSHLFSCSLV